MTTFRNARVSNKKGSSVSQKKKQQKQQPARRGMGVAKLETLRVQECWKTVTDRQPCGCPLLLPELLGPANTPLPPELRSALMLHRHQKAMINGNRGFPGCGRFPNNTRAFSCGCCDSRVAAQDQVRVDPYYKHGAFSGSGFLAQSHHYEKGSGNNVGGIEPSFRDLSSIPKMHNHVDNNNCSFCLKKKLIFSGYGGVFGLNGGMMAKPASSPIITNGGMGRGAKPELPPSKGYDFLGLSLGGNSGFINGDGQNKQQQGFDRLKKDQTRPLKEEHFDFTQTNEGVEVKKAVKSIPARKQSGRRLVEHNFFPVPPPKRASNGSRKTVDRKKSRPETVVDGGGSGGRRVFLTTADTRRPSTTTAGCGVEAFAEVDLSLKL